MGPATSGVNVFEVPAQSVADASAGTPLEVPAQSVADAEERRL
jgi:hypothetical protein